MGRRSRDGFHDHYLIDGGKARTVLNALVTPADVMGDTPMLPACRSVGYRLFHPGRTFFCRRRENAPAMGAGVPRG
jgi:hypothetical protein